MDFERQSGLFLHVTSLPGPDGIGTLGAPARQFVDWLAAAGQSLWQICPLGPTATTFANSPYQTYSAFAGNPLVIDLDRLHERGWLTDDDLADRPALDDHRVDYDAVEAYKPDLLWRAFERFKAEASADQRAALDAFATDNETWLADYALFRALKPHFDDAPWTEWPQPVRQRDPETLADYREDLADEVRYREFCQWVFAQQWTALREYANDSGIGIVGDMPIYVGLDSADAWANPELFDLDADNRPTAVAGMPTGGDGDGQRWGNPLYDWDAMAADGYQWWIDRTATLLDRVDVARVDHFLGFERYWAIPVDADAPSDGEWREGPGKTLFEAIRADIGDLPLMVEDLGAEFEAVHRLRSDLGFPGMVVAALADWCAEDHPHQPHTYPEQMVAYTTNHDLNTLVGWYENLDDQQRECLHYYLDTDGHEINWDLLNAVWASDAAIALAQLQDVLGLDADARFNTPGTVDGNWEWRVDEATLTDDVAGRLRDLTAHHDRV